MSGAVGSLCRDNYVECVQNLPVNGTCSTKIPDSSNARTETNEEHGISEMFINEKAREVDVFNGKRRGLMMFI